MDSADVIVGLVVAVALSFDFTNGFHDTANAMATTIATARWAAHRGHLAAILNFVGAFISLKVAATVAGGIVDAGAITPTVVFGGLIGAICWNLTTWWFGLPSSSSHALIGGVVGATSRQRAPAPSSSTGWSPRSSSRPSGRRSSPGAGRDRGLPRLPDDPPLLARAVRARVPLGPGRVVVDGRARAGDQRRPEDHGRDLPRPDRQRLADRRRRLPRPDWVVVSCATAIALGTYVGGWRIIKTLGTKVVEVRPPQGFGSETVAATVILASSHVGSRSRPHRWYPAPSPARASGARARSSTGSSRATSSSAGS